MNWLVCVDQWKSRANLWHKRDGFKFHYSFDTIGGLIGFSFAPNGEFCMLVSRFGAKFVNAPTLDNGTNLADKFDPITTRPFWVQKASLSSDSTKVLFVLTDPAYVGDQPEHVAIYDIASGTCLKRFDPNEHCHIVSAGISNSLNTAFLTNTGTLTCLTKDEKEAWTFDDIESTCAPAIHPKDPFLIALADGNGGHDHYGVVYLYRFFPGEESSFEMIAKHYFLETVESLKFSPDGSSLAVYTSLLPMIGRSFSNTISVWNVQKFVDIDQPLEHEVITDDSAVNIEIEPTEEHSSEAMAISSDGSLLASAFDFDELVNAYVFDIPEE